MFRNPNKDFCFMANNRRVMANTMDSAANELHNALVFDHASFPVERQWHMDQLVTTAHALRVTSVRVRPEDGTP